MPQEKLEITLKTSRDLFDFLMSKELQQSLFPLKVIFIIFAALFLAVIIYLSKKSSFWTWGALESARDFFVNKPMMAARKMNRQWNKIKRSADKKSEAQRKLAVLKARQLMLDSLQKMGLPEQSLEEKLRQLTKEQLNNIDELLAVEKLCQQILSNPLYSLEPAKAKEIINAFGRAFVDLELL